MDAGKRDNNGIEKKISPQGYSMLCVLPMANYASLFLVILLSLHSFQLPANTTTDPAADSTFTSQSSEPQNVFLEKIDILSNPPTEPVALKVDHQHRLWIVDKLGHKNTTLKGRPTSDTTEVQQKFRIITYEDVVGNGSYETSRVFMEWTEEHSANMTPVIYVDEDLLYLGTNSQLSLVKDIDHDGKADIKRELIAETGFGKQPFNVNGITKAPDGWLFFSMLDHELNDLNLSSADSPNPISAIFKCRPDGSDMQKIATGFNHPGDLVFDAFGNLFISDQDSNLSKESRWIYVIEGGDYGYRNANDQASDQPTTWSQGHLIQVISTAILPTSNALPPIANIQGRFHHIVYASANGIKENTDHRFFAIGSGNRSKGIYAFSQTREGAFFKLSDFAQWNLNVSANDMALGPEGQLYLTQSADHHAQDQGNGIYTLVHHSLKYAPESIRTASILRSDLSKHATARLLPFLQHDDQRVRTKAQATLVQRGRSTLQSLVNTSKDPKNLWTRLHAIWAIGQLVETDSKTANGNFIQSWISDLLKDPSPEVRAQAAIQAGRIGTASIHPSIVDSLTDPSQRVRQMAAISIGKLKPKGAWDAILEFIDTPSNHHPTLQHAGVIAMAGACSEDALSTLVVHNNPQVRWSSTLALRKKRSAKIARFLTDDSTYIVLEAARSIHDYPIQEALPKLAQLHKNRSEWISKFEISSNDSLSEPGIAMLYYVYHANFILGKTEHLKTIASAACDDSLPEPIRSMCLHWVRTWLDSERIESETNQNHFQKTLKTTASKAILKQKAKEWLASSNAGQQEIMLDYVETFNWKEFKASVASMFRTFNAEPEIRAKALKLLYQWEPNNINPFLNEALISNSALVRKEAILIQAKLDSNDQVAQWTHQLEFGEIKEKQEALLKLSSILDRRVDAVILHWLERALQNDLPPDLSQHLQQAAAQRTPPAVKRSLKQWQSTNQFSADKE